jgi:hypothetical protein
MENFPNSPPPPHRQLMHKQSQIMIVFLSLSDDQLLFALFLPWGGGGRLENMKELKVGGHGRRISLFKRNVIPSFLNVVCHVHVLNDGLSIQDSSFFNIVLMSL